MSVSNSYWHTVASSISMTIGSRSSFDVYLNVVSDCCAPESLARSSAGTSITSKKSDMFMIGGVMYEVISGCEPFYWVAHEYMFQARNALMLPGAYRTPYDEAVRLDKFQLIIDVSSAGPEFEPGLIALMQRCFQLDPAARPDAVEVIVELDRLNALVTGVPRSPAAARDRLAAARDVRRVYPGEVLEDDDATAVSDALFH